MRLEKILKKLEKYTNIPRLSFLFETTEYVYMADTMNQVNYILQNLSLIEGNKQNLKKYRDDPETVKNIKENIKYSEKVIEECLENLEENYSKHNRILHNYNENCEEDEL